MSKNYQLPRFSIISFGLMQFCNPPNRFLGGKRPRITNWSLKRLPKTFNKNVNERKVQNKKKLKFCYKWQNLRWGKQITVFWRVRGPSHHWDKHVNRYNLEKSVGRRCDRLKLLNINSVKNQSNECPINY